MQALRYYICVTIEFS